MVTGLVDSQRFLEVLEREGHSALAAWVGGGATMEMADLLNGGQSGDPVMTVYFKSIDNAETKFVLKLVKDVEKLKTTDSAWRTAGAFQRHLAEPLNHFEVGDRGAISIQRLAGNSLREWRPLRDEKSPQAAAERMAAVVSAVLADWGRVGKEGSSTMRVHEFVGEGLGHRIQANGMVRAWAIEHRMLDHGGRPIIFKKGERAWPNPFLLLDENEPAGSLSLRKVYKGPAHGDLHSGNVIVRTPSGAADEFVLIDYDRFHSNALLSRDIGRLLLSILDPFLIGLEEGDSAALMTALASGREAAGPLPGRIDQLLSHFERAALQWADGAKLLDEWHEQVRLSMISCALMYTGRPGEKIGNILWFLRFAAKATEAFLLRNGLPLPSGEPLQVNHLNAVSSASGRPDEDPFPESSWEELRARLREARFDADEWHRFAEGTRELNRELSRRRPAFPGIEPAAGRYLREIPPLLTEAARPSTSKKARNAASRRAEYLCGLLLGLLDRRA